LPQFRVEGFCGGNLSIVSVVECSTLFFECIVLVGGE
jgi:hypothetical protein